MLKSEIAVRWVAALRSPEFEQARYTLRQGTTNKYCCLGVLCELYRRETGEGSWSPEGKFDDGAARSDTGCTPTVRTWAGLDSHDMDMLMDLNDGVTVSHEKPVGFKTIATVIEELL